MCVQGNGDNKFFFFFFYLFKKCEKREEEGDGVMEMQMMQSEKW